IGGSGGNPSGRAPADGSTGGAGAAGHDAGATGPTTPAASVVTQHNDLARTGLNPNETILSPTTVDAAHFGKKFAQPVDGWIYAQPLLVPQVAIPDMGTHDVVYVATENDSVYAFDANTKQPALWHVSFLSTGVTAVPAPDTNETTIAPEVGITGTPVIDVASSTLYVVSETKTTAGATYAYHLHALDLATGAEKLGGPVAITGGVAGQAPDAVGGTVSLSPLHGGQRAGLALFGGVLYIPFAGHGDRFQYWHGWVFGYDATTLAQKFVYCSTPDANAGAIWQSGAGVAVDGAGSLYVETGNGSFDGMGGGRDMAMSVLKLSPAGKLVDWFAPYNAVALSAADVDLGSAGPMLLPDQTGAHAHLMIGTGKPGYLYLLDRDQMGHFNAGGDIQIVQKVAVHGNSDQDSAGVFATPVYFNGRVYVSAVDDGIKAYSLTAGALSTTPVSQTSRTFANQAHLAVSSNGAAGGIVWMLLSDGFQPTHAAVLYAFDASDLTKELYDSAQAPAMRDAAGPSSKFLVPTVANGHVYVATQTELDVYGAL
ncbi:MAG TPA: pyrrolo-quinoline quinone, partial [Polyangia bacterium]|nr:pyrrolo-quinoline quinone [Polyangia bacterium]